MSIVGIDPSYNGTGVCLLLDKTTHIARLSQQPESRETEPIYAAATVLVSKIGGFISQIDSGVDKACVEGPVRSYGRASSSVEMLWALGYAIWSYLKYDCNFDVQVAQPTLTKQLAGVKRGHSQTVKKNLLRDYAIQVIEQNGLSVVRYQYNKSGTLVGRRIDATSTSYTATGQKRYKMSADEAEALLLAAYAEGLIEVQEHE